MKYRVFDVDNKAEYTKEMGFDELKGRINLVLIGDVWKLKVNGTT